MDSGVVDGTKTLPVDEGVANGMRASPICTNTDTDTSSSSEEMGRPSR